MPEAIHPETEAKILCVKVTRPETNGGDFCVWKWDQFDAKAEMDGGEIGEKITLELCEMTVQELEDLGDFNGW